jgi:hypothetical protein
MEQSQSGRLQAEQIASEDRFDWQVGKLLFLFLLEIEAELRKMARDDSRASRNKMPTFSMVKDPKQPRGGGRLSRYIE